MDDPNMHTYGDHYPDDSEVPGAHPPPDHPLSRLAARLGELLDEDQWAECERLLLDGWAHDVIDRKTGQQIRAAYTQGQKDSLSLLRRARNLLSHPPGWVDTPTNSESRYALSVEIAEHMNGLELSEAWTEKHKREWQEELRRGL